MSEHAPTPANVRKALESIATSCGFHDLTHLRTVMLRSRSGACPACGRPLETQAWTPNVVTRSRS